RCTSCGMSSQVRRHTGSSAQKTTLSPCKTALKRATPAFCASASEPASPASPPEPLAPDELAAPAAPLEPAELDPAAPGEPPLPEPSTGSSCVESLPVQAVTSAASADALNHVALIIEHPSLCARPSA